MNFKKSGLWLSLIACLVFVSACKKGDEEPSKVYQNGVYIVNEGPFQSGSGTVSYYYPVENILKQDIFGTENGGAALGNVLQSMSLHEGKAYLIANNANKLTVVDAKTFAQNNTLSTELKLPRYFVGIDAKTAYLSQWGTDSATSGVLVYDISTNKIAKTIPTGKGADRLLRNPNTGRIWVLNSGGLGQDSTVTIVDVSKDSVVQKLVVGPAPSGIVVDANGDTWVLCAGYYPNVAGRLVKIRNNAVEQRFTISYSQTSQIGGLSIDPTGKTLYYFADNKIYTKDLLNFGTTPPSVLMSLSGVKYLYGMGVDPKSGYLYVADALDFKSASAIQIIDPSTKTVKANITGGIGTNGFVFN
jgi:streptogramin lyase